MSLAIQLKGQSSNRIGHIHTSEPTTETESITEICIEFNDNLSAVACVNLVCGLPLVFFMEMSPPEVSRHQSWALW